MQITLNDLIRTFLLTICCSCLLAKSLSANNFPANSLPVTTDVVHQEKAGIVVGAEQVATYLPLIKNKRVGLVVNQTSQITNTHLVDRLLQQQVNIQAIFAPEHGFRGKKDAGEYFDSTTDFKTGIKVHSLYGKQRKPDAKLLNNLDVIIFDIQDVGVRYYTYISTMHYMMEAAAESGLSFIVLDRPNPNGKYVDGPILEEQFKSFVGMHKIPLLHGMTVGELAQMIFGEKWLNTNEPLDLQIIPIKNYARHLPYSLPIKPSPNLPNDQAIALYASLGFFEATPVSIGRGTPRPFQVIGHDNIKIDQFSFTPVPMEGAKKPKLMNKKLYGQDLTKVETNGLSLKYLLLWHQAFQQQGKVFFDKAKFMDKLAGTDKLRKAIMAGKSESQIRQGWQQGLTDFKQLRAPYLLYP